MREALPGGASQLALSRLGHSAAAPGRKCRFRRSAAGASAGASASDLAPAPAPGPFVCSRAYIRAACGDPSMDVHPPPPSLSPAAYGDLLHFDLAGLHQPSPDDCARLAGAFPDAVSLIEWAEQLRAWGAAPEQRLALYFRRLPTVSAGETAWGVDGVEGPAWQLVMVSGGQRRQVLHQAGSAAILHASHAPPLRPPCALLQSPDSDARLISVVPHTGAWEARVALLHARMSAEGPATGAGLQRCGLV